MTRHGRRNVVDNAPESLRGLPVAKPNYSFEKRQRELAKKKKKEEKAARKSSPDARDEPAGADAQGAPAEPPVAPVEGAGQP